MMSESPLWQKDSWKTRRRRKVGKYTSGHNDSIDDAPPPGFHRNELTVAPPPTLAGVTSAQLERSAQKGGPSTQAAHIAEALEKKED